MAGCDTAIKTARRHSSPTHTSCVLGTRMLASSQQRLTLNVKGNKDVGIMYVQGPTLQNTKESQKKNKKSHTQKCWEEQKTKQHKKHDAAIAE